MPKIASHRLSHQQAVACMRRTAEISHRIAINVASHQFRIRLEAARANHDSFIGFHKIRVAFVYGFDAQDLVSSSDQSSGRTINKNRNIPRLYCAIKDSEETVAAFRAGNISHRHLVHAICARQILIARVSVYTDLSFGSQ
ncbi:unknown [Proteobacteria bacterium CAG:139]|nr:unknown [Proteobacteria bacterium CAG:139]